MATVLDEWPATKPYPWDDWFDGRIWQLHRGKDFGGTPEEFRRTILRNARDRGIRVRTHVRDVVVVVQRLEGGR